MTYSSLLPEELKKIRAINVEGRDLAGISFASSSFLWVLIIFGAGLCLGWLCGENIESDLVNAVIAFDGAMIGFVIAAMLFSGRNQYVTDLSYDQLVLYVVRTKILLYSQITTLFAFVICLVFCLISLLSMKSGYVDRAISVSLATGFFMIGAYKVCVLPFDIYDVHKMALDGLLEESARANTEGARSMVSDAIAQLKKR